MDYNAQVRRDIKKHCRAQVSEHLGRCIAVQVLYAMPFLLLGAILYLVDFSSIVTSYVMYRQILPGVGAAPRQIAAHGRTGIAHLRPIVGKRKAAFRQTIDLLFGQLQIENAAQQRIERRSVFKKRPQLSGLAGFR